MVEWQHDPFYCLWIYDLQNSSYDAENKISTWQHLKVKKVDILGTVIAAKTYEKRSEYEIDDGTGVIHCCWFHRKPATAPTARPAGSASSAAPAARPAAHLERLELGTLLHVRGGLQEYRDKKQVVAYSLRVVTDLDEESARVCRQLELYKRVYKVKPGQGGEEARPGQGGGEVKPGQVGEEVKPGQVGEEVKPGQGGKEVKLVRRSSQVKEKDDSIVIDTVCNGVLKTS